MQNDLAAKAWPFDDALEQDFRAAFAPPDRSDSQSPPPSKKVHQ
jgi:hypothetical protein